MSVLGLLKGAMHLKNFFGILLSHLIIKPTRVVVKSVFKRALVPLYRVYLLAKKGLTIIFAPAKNRLLYPLIHKSTIHVVLIVIAFAVIANNIIARETRAEEYGQATILASMISDNQDIDIVETAITDIPKVTTYYRDIGVLTPSDKSFASSGTNSAIGGGGEIITTESSAALVQPGLVSTTIGQRPREAVTYYIVEGGDTVSTIAEKFSVSTDTILWENNLGPRDYIKPGDKLTVLPQSGVSHQIKSGDTIAKLAKKYEVEENSILDYNKLADASAIEVDQIVIIPGGIIEPPAPLPTYGGSRSSGYTSIPASAPVASGTKLQWPAISHKINQYYRWGHYAIDIEGDYSSPVYASDDGRVELADSSQRGYGLQIVINHGNGLKTRYAHESKLFVSVGDFVSRGQTIGMIGCTGWCTGPHIHFEVMINGQKVNPLSYF